MDAIILVGGLGTRLREAVPDVPKPMAPIGGSPFLDIILKQLGGFGDIRKAVLAAGYKADHLLARYRDNRQFGVEIDFSVERTPMGTGGAICQALPSTDSESVLVLNGDSYVDYELSGLVETHNQHNALVTLVVIEVPDTTRFGSLKTDPGSGKVLEFMEKGDSKGRGLINAGVYLLRRSAFEKMPLEAASFERDFLPGLLARTYAHLVNGLFIDIGVPDSYRIAETYLQGRRC
jgi:NDP-sugar pyrophosphorylase family protein